MGLYPDRATLTAEDMERPPEVFVVVSDAAGDMVRRVPVPRGAGLHRIAWDLRYASLEPPTPGGGEADGPMVAPRRVFGPRGSGHRRRLRGPHGPAVLHGQAPRHVSAFEERLFEIGRVLSRDRTALDRAEFAPPSVMQRISRIVGAQFRATSAPTTTQRESYAVASAQLAELSAALRALVEEDLAAISRAPAVSCSAPSPCGNV